MGNHFLRVGPQVDPSMTEITRRWYWDRRTRKALYPIKVDGETDTVRFVSVWHREEVADALAGDVLVDVEEVSSENVDTTFDLLDSFRLPDVEGDDE